MKNWTVIGRTLKKRGWTRQSVCKIICVLLLIFLFVLGFRVGHRYNGVVFSDATMNNVRSTAELMIKHGIGYVDSYEDLTIKAKDSSVYIPSIVTSGFLKSDYNNITTSFSTYDWNVLQENNTIKFSPKNNTYGREILVTFVDNGNIGIIQYMNESSRVVNGILFGFGLVIFSCAICTIAYLIISLLEKKYASYKEDYIEEENKFYDEQADSAMDKEEEEYKGINDMIRRRYSYAEEKGIKEAREAIRLSHEDDVDVSDDEEVEVKDELEDEHDDEDVEVEDEQEEEHDEEETSDEELSEEVQDDEDKEKE